MSIGIPIKLLHEAEGHVVTLETTAGEVYRGKLVEAEDNMNVQLQNIQVTARDGRTTQSEQVFIRGSMIRFLILPDMLKNAPMFKPKPTGSRGMSAGGGKSALLRAKGKKWALLRKFTLASLSTISSLLQLVQVVEDSAEDFVEAEEGFQVEEVEVAIARDTANCLYHLLWFMKFCLKILHLDSL